MENEIYSVLSGLCARVYPVASSPQIQELITSEDTVFLTYKRADTTPERNLAGDREHIVILFEVDGYCRDYASLKTLHDAIVDELDNYAVAEGDVFLANDQWLDDEVYHFQITLEAVPKSVLLP